MKHPRNRITKTRALTGSIIAIAMLAGAYIYQVNTMTNLAYQVAEKEQNIAKLTAETRSLTAAYAKTVSFRDFEELASAMNFEKIDRISYVQIPGTTVAQNQ